MHNKASRLAGLVNPPPYWQALINGSINLVIKKLFKWIGLLLGGSALLIAMTLTYSYLTETCLDGKTYLFEAASGYLSRKELPLEYLEYKTSGFCSHTFVYNSEEKKYEFMLVNNFPDKPRFMILNHNADGS